jgi:hypothetical protein
MTKDQIDVILSDIEKDEWVDVGNKFKYILLISDRTLFCHGSAVRFYFPSTKNFFLIKNLDGKLISEELLENPLGYEPFFYKGNGYYIKAFDGGKEYSSAGNYHEIIAYDSITGFFKI